MTEIERKSGKALTLLSTLGAEPTPAAYSVAYRMVDEPMGELARAVEQRVRLKQPLDEEFMADMVVRHVEGGRARALGLASAQLGAQLASVLGLVAEAGRASGEFGDSLSRAGERAGVAPDKAALAAIVGGIVEHARAMEIRQEELTRDLRDREAQVASINSLYTAAMTEARKDGLTGLANRKRFDEDLYRETHRSDRGHGDVSLLLLDIDHFKRVNDTHGHQAGDMVLRQVGDIILSCVRRHIDTAARIGGEEFGILLPGADEDAAVTVAERIRTSVESALFREGGLDAVLDDVTVSLGLATHNPGERPELLFRRADACLYGAKRAGRNRLVRESAMESGPRAPSR